MAPVVAAGDDIRGSWGSSGERGILFRIQRMHFRRLNDMHVGGTEVTNGTDFAFTDSEAVP